MNTNMIGHDQAHLMGESATHPIEPPWRVLAALLLPADTTSGVVTLCQPTPWRRPTWRVQLPFLGSTVGTSFAKMT